MSRCAAKSKRTGEQCKNAAMTGKRVCRHHGGKSLAGGDSPSFKTGRYSQSLKGHPEVLAAYERFRDDPDLMEIKNEIALMRALVDRLANKPLQRFDERAAGAFLDLLESITKAVERRHKMLNGEKVTITVAHFETLAAQLFDAVRRIYGDDDRYAELLNECSGYSITARDRAGAGT